MRKVLKILLVLLVAGALFWGHAAYHYAPRLRPAAPDPGDLAARLLEDESFSHAVWMPYPHQNLGFLEEQANASGANTPSNQAPDAAALVEAVSRLAGLPVPRLPAFGTLRLPPASQIAFAAEPDGERYAVVAHVYPVMAAFARLAGELADNPWLGGGRFTREDREVEVAWDGDVWMVGSPVLPDLGGEPDPGASPGTSDTKSLMVARVREALPPLPAGRFRLTADADGVSILSETPLPETLPVGPEIASELGRGGLFLLVAEGRRILTGEPSQAMLFFSQDEDVAFSHEGTTYELPGMASIYEPGSERWTLPGEKLLRWTGRKTRDADVDGWSVAAIDGDSLARVQGLVPAVGGLIAPAGEGGARLSWGVWLDLDAGLDEVRLISRATESLPLVSERRRQRWRDAATVLSATAERFSHLTLFVSEEPHALELRLRRR